MQSLLVAKVTGARFLLCYGGLHGGCPGVSQSLDLIVSSSVDYSGRQGVFRVFYPSYISLFVHGLSSKLSRSRTSVIFSCSFSVNYHGICCLSSVMFDSITIGRPSWSAHDCKEEPNDGQLISALQCLYFCEMLN